jgi:hypothetical protein
LRLIVLYNGDASRVGGYYQIICHLSANVSEKPSDSQRAREDALRVTKGQ